MKLPALTHTQASDADLAPGEPDTHSQLYRRQIQKVRHDHKLIEAVDVIADQIYDMPCGEKAVP